MNAAGAGPSHAPVNHADHTVHRLWTALGSPVPFETDGKSIKERGLLGACAVTGGPASYRYEDGLSANFSLARHANKAFRHAHLCGPKLLLSAAAVFASKTLAFRCAPWILEPTAAGDRVSFHCSLAPPKDDRLPQWTAAWGSQAPDSFLTWLMRVRPAGTVAALPLYGIEHGGEVNLSRCCWPRSPIGEMVSGGRPRPDGYVHVPDDPLVKLQAKHVAIFAPPSPRAGVLALQVDSDATYEVDVARWRRYIEPAIELLDELMQAGMTEFGARTILRTRVAEPHRPRRVHLLMARLPERIPPSITRDAFWPIFSGAIYA